MNLLQLVYFLESHEKDFSLQTIIDVGDSALYPFLFFALSIPSALPIPATGYSIPFSITIILFAIQALIGKKNPYIPEKIKKLKLPQKIINKAIPFVKKILLFIEKKFPARDQAIPISRISILLIIGLAVIMGIPIPFTNTLPAFCICMISLTHFHGNFLLKKLTVILSGVVILMYVIIALFSYFAITSYFN